MNANILENISLTASIISGLTAFTTSLRALGKSREILRSDTTSSVASGCRIKGLKDAPFQKNSSLLIHAVSTITWLILTILFAIPPFFLDSKEIVNEDSLYFLIPLAILVVLICLIWSKALSKSVPH